MIAFLKRIWTLLVSEAEHVAHSIVQFEQKEIAMIPQSIADAIARIKAALSSHSGQGAADAQTISDLRAQFADLQARCAGHESTIADLTAAGAAKDAQISNLGSQIADIEAQLVALAGDPAVAPVSPPVAAQPADGSGSSDPTP